jgi:hypothetical protein
LRRRSTSPWRGHVLFIFSTAVFFLISVLASLAARGVWPAARRPSAMAAVWIGFANALTILGVLFAALRAARKLGLPRGRALAHAALMSAVFCGLLAALALVFSAV